VGSSMRAPASLEGKIEKGNEGKREKVLDEKENHTSLV